MYTKAKTSGRGRGYKKMVPHFDTHVVNIGLLILVCLLKAFGFKVSGCVRGQWNSDFQGC